ncbi:MAG TPA: Xaa-Pro aminopeptidase [Vicinamibacterales bacterium]|nr:Xaa-Pro aminopeptidase [Vicinamibacterales bacterium]
MSERRALFPATTYRDRRRRLARDVGSGLILLLGNEEVGMNYMANVYPFRQDSTFLYFWSVDQPGLAAVIDVDAGTETLFGDDVTMADVVWSGPQPSIADRAAEAAVGATAPKSALADHVGAAVAQGRPVHFLAPYRGDHTVTIAALLGITPSAVKDRRSQTLHAAVAAQRLYKTPEEVAEIEFAVGVSRDMYLAAMRAAAPGRMEHEIVGEIARVVIGRGCNYAFPPICSVHGETLHNPFYRNTLNAGDWFVLDSGVETPAHYASDITRTIPVSGTFSTQQRAIYECVLRAQSGALAAIKPGVPYRDVHRGAARSFVTDLTALGLMKGDADAAVAAGAHALFFPHGLGHMMGLDVHDMENLGEDIVGYGQGYERSTQFGLGYLRLARPLEPGFVITVEPGLYFIPALIDQWKAEGRHAAFINWTEVEKFRDARGCRLEDDVLVTATGGRVLGPGIPKAIAEVEAACAFSG